MNARGGCARCGGFLLPDMEYDRESNHWERVDMCANCGHIAGRGRPPTAEEMVPEIAETRGRQIHRPRRHFEPAGALDRARGIEASA